MNTAFHHKSRKPVVAALAMAGLLLWTAGACLAVDPGEGLPGDWLNRYASPRSVGLGGAGVALGEDVQSALGNPAGLSWLVRNQVEVTSTRLQEDTSVNGLGFVLPSNRMPSFGFNILHLSSGQFQRTNELNESLGTFDQGNLALTLTAAQQLGNRFAAGASVKFLRQTLEDYSGSGVGFDLGVMGRILPGVQVGASALNLGGPTIRMRDTDESYLEEYRAGVAIHLLEGQGLVSAEVVHRDGPGSQVRAGAEYRVGDLALRAGYFIDNIAAGFGYDFRNGLRFDYGMSDHELGLVHRFGLEYRFGGFQASARVTPEVFSPMGLHPVAKFLLTTRLRHEARNWRLIIVDRSGQTVRTYGGQGRPPAQIIWDGKDASGLPLPEGRYRYRFTVTEIDGRVTTGREHGVEIRTSGPQGSVGVQ